MIFKEGEKQYNSQLDSNFCRSYRLHRERKHKTWVLNHLVGIDLLNNLKIVAPRFKDEKSDIINSTSKNARPE